MFRELGTTLRRNRDEVPWQCRYVTITAYIIMSTILRDGAPAGTAALENKLYIQLDRNCK